MQSDFFIFTPLQTKISLLAGDGLPTNETGRQLIAAFQSSVFHAV
jgi:hypothetical protein